MLAPDLELIRVALLFATPLLLAAVGELIVERAGMVNIGIEGMMLAGALGAWAVNAQHGAAAGVLGGMAAGVLLGLLFAIVTLGFAADQIVTGAGINLLALGVTGLLYRTVESALAELPVSGIDPYVLIVLAPLLAAAAWLFLRFTRAGLELRAIGENPHAADTAGVAVRRRKLYAVLFGAGCAGLAGAYLSTMRVQGFVENMTEGQGFLALAMVIFGRWQAGGIVAAGVFFGLVRAYADRLVIAYGYEMHAAKLFSMLPYVVSLLALAGVAGRSHPPAALGRAYVRA